MSFWYIIWQLLNKLVKQREWVNQYLDMALNAIGFHSAGDIYSVSPYVVLWFRRTYHTSHNVTVI